MADFRLGILGAGNIARAMAKTAVLMDGVQPYAIAARDGARAAAFAAEYGFEKACAGYEALVADDKVDLIYIATPHSHHAEQALLCIEAGRPVLCEKAFTGNAAQARAVLAAAAEKKIFVTEAMWTRFLPMMQTLRAAVAGGDIGRPALIRAAAGGVACHSPRATDPALAGGALLDVGIYPLTLAVMLFGPGHARITSDAYLLPTGVDGCNTMILRWAEGQMADLSSSIVNGFGQGWTVYGDEGRLEVEGIYNPQSARLLDNQGNEKKRYTAPPQHTGYEYEVAASMEAIAEGRLECGEMPHAETLRMMALMDGLRESWGMRYPFD